MKTYTLSGFLWMVLLFASLVNCSSGQTAGYVLQICDQKDQVLIECRFSGKDVNNDGVIEVSELDSFSETEDYKLSHTSKNTSLQAYADLDKLPMLTHTAEDIRTFRFFEAEFDKGNMLVDYHTNSKNELIFNSYHFWRDVKIENNGKKIGIFRGVGDGTKGLQVSLLDTSGFTFKITKR